MKAARLQEFGIAPRVDDVPTPSPGHGEVLVRVAGAGFCHSDVHIIDGDLHVTSELPVTLGHENAGFVAAVGPGVRAVAEGDPVAVFGGWGCGACPWCVSGDEQLCSAPQWPGILRDGGYAEYLLVPHARHLIRLDRLTPRDAAPLTDAALTPYRAVKKALPVLTPDVPAVVIGLGGLGQYGVKLLRLLTASPVIAIDVVPSKIDLGRELGATYTLDGRADDLAEQIRACTDGQGVGAVLDFVGSDTTLALALAATRTGGKVIQVGLAGGAARLEVLENVRFEVGFEVSLWGNVKELREVLALAERGDLTPIPIEFAPLDAVANVYSRVRSGQVEGRIVITP